MLAAGAGFAPRAASVPAAPVAAIAAARMISVNMMTVT
jgi:hypothetical protein